LREDGKRYPLPVMKGDIVVLGGACGNVHLNGDKKHLFVVDVDSIWGVVKANVRFAR
jgi:co-chaperonin GroES (HSP10)